MQKSKKAKTTADAAPSATTASKLTAREETVDPVLASLFASSSGPIKVPPRTGTTAKPAPLHVQPNPEDETSSSGSSSSAESDSENDAEDSDESSEDEAPPPKQEAKDTVERPRKRKRAVDEDDLEQAYFKRLELEEDRENRKKHPGRQIDNAEGSSNEDNTSSSDSNDSSLSEPSEVEVPPKHEIFDQKLKDQDKLKRTVFLGNVSTQAIKTKTAKRALTRHLRSVLKTPLHGKRPGKLESVRFRSTAYASKQGPKKATYAKKELMDATTVSTNAYAVFTTDIAAERVAEELNGTIVLDRHLRVDYLAKPSVIDHKRCVFIGNLSFVNEEAPAGSADDGEGLEKKRRPTAKQPADAEEGLWRTFSKVGKVESVRVVRDQETRVGKGFAYVQFKDENSVEAALLMNDKKFPPMLPRKLRVMRARKMKIKRPMFTPRANSAQDRNQGRRDGMSAAGGRDGKPKQPLVFEGHRATSTFANAKGKAVDVASSKRNRDRKRNRPDSKSAQRSAKYKAAKARRQKLGGK
ncbi:uncharacterized protein Z519_06976 [Cladophialophora bantiana CBS 173.52]|uniref:Nucleolar protein 12 n=1 Tax=Cladophialophora bantiana (strain ATCC 10958 / CBS 173.52 / CDC B-1940 / NIH 8579) TaxID=1442370 RepID=A0A0D2I566_CLAB1|nr:uncharacterized protein Z519_06976 [Cladophialophora bantiana CBS 173.52]KIW91994.1 hypothetical protein Z519_06976 [Cladophialophora bantiana CBS 173.52]